MARKKELTEGAEIEAQEEDSAAIRVYELGFHLEPELSQEEVKKAYAGIHGVIESKGTVIAEGAPEKIPLAYTISRTETTGRRDFDSAFFCWIAYEANGVAHEAITEAAKAEKRIIRFLDIKSSKEEAAHSAEMREIREKMPEPQTEESISDADLDAALESAVV